MTTETNYAQFTNLALTDNSVEEYVIDQVSVNDVSPTLLVRSATDNKAYRNAMIKRTSKTLQRAAAKGKIDGEFIEDNRKTDRELYAKYVVVGWRDLYDAEGNEVPYSQREALALMRALPGWMFDELRAFCGDAENFTGDGHIEVEAKAKKSAKASNGS